LHYAQEIFEGLKAYKQNNGELALFRPQSNIERMTHSSIQLAMPVFPEDQFLEGIIKITRENAKYAPDVPGSLYLRPTMIATTPHLGVSPAQDYLFYILVSPVGGYFEGQSKLEITKISVQVSEKYVRAVRGGIGNAKTGGNYAASLRAIKEAKAQGYTNVLFLDAIERKYLEELGGMNVFAVINNELHTPRLTDSILAGVTRDSILQLCEHKGIVHHERDISIEEILKGLSDGSVQELFACGTAAVIAAITELGWRGDKIPVGNKKIGPITQKLFDELTAIHYGKKQAFHPEWILKI
jgi:branched-chain amino acid aminotransferase